MVPTTLDLYFFFRCDWIGDRPMTIDFTVNGHRYPWDFCGATLETNLKERDWIGYDVAVGQPSMFALTVTGLRGDTPDERLPVPDHGRVGFAIGEALSRNT